MKRHMIWFLKYLVATTLTVAVSAAIVHAAYAGSRNVNRSWSGANGSHSVSKSESWGNGAWNRDALRTGPNGNSVERNTQRTYQQGQGTTYNNTTTLPSGSTIMRSRSVTPTGDGGVTVNRDVTGPNGNSGSVTRTYNGQ
jgi:hypothetical protein